jgi:hypothetical protein
MHIERVNHLPIYETFWLISFLEHAPATDAIDRALFTYERAFIGSFTFTSGHNRLDFDRAENRPFYLAIHRQAM